MLCSSGLPYCWTTFSPGTPAIAVRTASSPTGFSNLKTTMVPPEKSMPSGSPRWTTIPTPARMTSADRAMACQRHLMKS